MVRSRPLIPTLRYLDFKRFKFIFVHHLIGINLTIVVMDFFYSDRSRNKQDSPSSDSNFLKKPTQFLSNTKESFHFI